MVEHVPTISVLDEAAVTAFRASMRGTVLGPEDTSYEIHRRVWNRMIDKHPRLIARCAGVADVLAALQFARDQHLLVAVRGGGHNVAGNATCDDGLVIDLSPMKGVRVDPVHRTVQAQAGLTWGELDRETQAFGLATPGGLISTTGIAGLTLGGGIGWLTRKYGLACDNLLSVDVVTADGRFLTANDTEHADLFWGVRGGGGNFGIVTSFQYRLHPLSTVLGGLIVYSASQAQEALRFYRDFCVTASEELTTIASFATLPADPSLPQDLHHLPVVVVGACHTGPLDAAERAVQPLRAFGPPLLDALSPTPYCALQTMQDAAFPAGLQHYWRSAYLDELSDEIIALLAEHAAAVTSPLCGIDIHQMGGAAARVPAGATAFGHRDAAYLINMYAVWTDPSEAERHIAWLGRLSVALRPFSRGLYVNFLADTVESGVRDSYDVAAYERLVALKTAYDPTNLFRLNHNIRPRSA